MVLRDPLWLTLIKIQNQREWTKCIYLRKGNTDRLFKGNHLIKEPPAALPLVRKRGRRKGPERNVKIRTLTITPSRPGWAGTSKGHLGPHPESTYRRLLIFRCLLPPLSEERRQEQKRADKCQPNEMEQTLTRPESPQTLPLSLGQESQGRLRQCRLSQ